MANNKKIKVDGDWNSKINKLIDKPAKKTVKKTTKRK